MSASLSTMALISASVIRGRSAVHATRMLAAGLAQCRDLGLARVLLTCAADNEPSRRVILANGGVPDGQQDGEDRFWISLGRGRHS